jgi:hypothetical protein
MLDGHILKLYQEIRRKKSNKNCSKKKKQGGIRKSSKRVESDQSILYECMEISQRKHFVQLMYTNFNGKNLIKTYIGKNL